MDIDFDMLENECKFNTSDDERKYIEEKFKTMLNNAKNLDKIENLKEL